MDEYRNQAYLLNDQYKNSTKFGARVELNRRFSVNKYSFPCWIFDHFNFGEGCNILELGCGPGLLWAGNRERIPASWQITLTDFSPGMLQEARQWLGEERFTYQVVDAQELPYADASFDAVIANHMLYHVPDIQRALGEIRRVLKPAGHFFASTIGREHMREMRELVRKHWPDNPRAGTRSFTLENGAEILAPFFVQVTLDRYIDALEVTEAEPLAAYVFSGRGGSFLSAEARESFTDLIRQELAQRGSIHITKATGLFEASKA